MTSILSVYAPVQSKRLFAESAELSGYMKFDDVREWENITMANGEAYLQFKEEKAERFIKKLNDSFPGIMNNIGYYETSTPLDLPRLHRYKRRFYVRHIATPISPFKHTFHNALRFPIFSRDKTLTRTVFWG